MTASLFDKYGGFANISKVVSAFYERAIDSDIIGPYFDDVDMRAMVDHQTKFIASVMGGPASYSDEALHKVHASHHIDHAAFAEMAALLRQTLVDSGIQPDDVELVMNEIAARESVVVTRHDS